MSRRRARAGLVVLLWPSMVAATALEGARLFTTAPERARLERLRAGAAIGEAAEVNAATLPRAGNATSADGKRAASAGAAPVPRLRLRGFVRRSDGPGAAWVNDASTLDPAGLPGGLRLRRPPGVAGGTVEMVLPDGRAVRLEPGQTWDPDSGRVIDAYGTGP